MLKIEFAYTYQSFQYVIDTNKHLNPVNLYKMSEVLEVNIYKFIKWDI